MKKIISFLILTVLITSCHQKNAGKTSYSFAEIDEEMIPITRQLPNVPPPPVNKIENHEVVKKKIIKDGRLGLRVNEIEGTKLRIDTLILNY